MKIGVFDSGVGGLSVAKAIEAAMPGAEVYLKEDKENLPYGTKTPEQLFKLVRPILDQMAAEGCQVIVIACNTVTTTIIKKLRKVIKVPLVGMEPMVKPAAEATKTGVIAVFATPTTLGSKRYAWLKKQYAKGIKVVEPDCSKWALMVQNNQVEVDEIKKNVDSALQNNADVIVLGCTHYHWIEDLVRQLAANQAVVIQPEQPVIDQLNRVIQELK